LIDLAVTHGVPDFASTLTALLSEMQVQSHVLAEELLLHPSPALNEVQRLHGEGALGTRQLTSHAQFKLLSAQARAIVRTGECRPYSNIALLAGVTF
jgi:D-ribose pyranase